MAISSTTVATQGDDFAAIAFDDLMLFVIICNVTLTWPVLRRPIGTVQYVSNKAIEWTISRAHELCEATIFIRFSALS